MSMHHVEPTKKHTNRKDLVKASHARDLKTYFGNLITQRTFDCIVRIIKHHLGNARIAEEMQARQNTRLNQLFSKSDKKCEFRDLNCQSFLFFCLAYWHFLQFSSLPSDNISNGSTAISSPLPQLKVSPLKMASLNSELELVLDVSSEDSILTSSAVAVRLLRQCATSF